MNIGDLVKITDKNDTGMWCSGVVKSLESQHSWGSAVTLFDDNVTLNTDHLKVRVIRAVEPTEIGSTYKSPDGLMYVKIGSTSDDWIIINPAVLVTKSWSEISNYSE